MSNSQSLICKYKYIVLFKFIVYIKYQTDLKFELVMIIEINSSNTVGFTYKNVMRYFLIS